MSNLTIRGWMREAERMALRRWAFGLDVLELGCYKGLSTSQLLVTAKSVHAVDTFDGRGTPEPEDTREEFHANMKSTGNYGKLATWPGAFDEVLPKMRERGYDYDLIFLDGSHDYDSVSADVKGLLPLLREGGALAFHDHCETFPGVCRVVAELHEQGWRCHEQADSLVLLRRCEVPPKPKVKLRVMIPHRGDCRSNIATAWALDSKLSQKYNRKVTDFGVSVLTQCFNTLWCDAMNEQQAGAGYTHVGMLHDDVAPEHYWGDLMVDEMDRLDLDFISAVVPIKNETGTTSTGVSDVEFPGAVRRLTMHEVMELPTTFGIGNIPNLVEGQELRLNTGCWFMRFDRPWWQGLKFRQQDDILRHDVTGEYMVSSLSEDWDWTMQLLSRGCRIAATRVVPLYHERHWFHNKSAWGTWKTDELFYENVRKAREYTTTVAEKPVER